MVSDATSSGPAATAIPSLRFVTHDEASNQRNLLPSRAGTNASTTLLTSRHRRQWHLSSTRGFPGRWKAAASGLAARPALVAAARLPDPVGG
ncbi:hypothetical protein Sar04_07580 [Salinispora arenicola]|uniref:Uncharacterized protein n=1 Tax=Salinispora arenicola TaxID=168697 RepID=A0ABQ4JMM8_SALAC|nr:hypothetical protein Sar04_07580 [Salinispora arenicola]